MKSNTHFFTLCHLIEKAAEAYPEKEAFRCGQESASYQEVKQRMLQIAFLLQDLGIKKGERVGIYMNRSLESVLAVYGIMQAGAAFVPLDPKLPKERIQFVIQDCQIRFLISHPGLEPKLQDLSKDFPPLQAILGLQSDQLASHSWDIIRSLPLLDSRKVNLLEQDLAYVMYTSGSTGQPKGIMHTHYSGLSYARLSVDLYELRSEDRVCSHSPLHYDISTFGYFSAPLAGATSIILPEAYTLMPASLSQLMESERLSIWYSVPLALIQLLQRGVLEKRNLESLRWVLFGGEPFPPKVLAGLMRLWPQAKFSNVYGPAEVNQCTYYTVPEIPNDDQALPLGQAWDNTDILLLNESEQEVAGGEIGEIMVRSATQMQGYWNRPDLSKKAFYTQEFFPGFVEKYYRTGDLGRYNEKGELCFLGRKDRQIKIRGYRVELTEIEGVLMQQEAIKEAAVYSFLDNKDEKNLQAQIILQQGAEPNLDELSNTLRQLLPWYALPKQIDIVNAFPRTGAGKIDYKTLEKEASK